jgi:hypothetical protein
MTRVDNRRPQHEILWRIADDGELGEHEQVGLLGRRTVSRVANVREVAGNIADRWIQLRKRNGE